MKAVVFGVLMAIGGQAMAAGKVLVVVSSARSLQVLLDKKTGELNPDPHPTGFFLSETMVPVKALRERGYDLVFANPEGNEPAMDSVSDNPMWFRDEAEYRTYRKECENLKLCSTEKGNRIAPEKVRKLSEVVGQGLDSFDGVLFPGGHAPMQDLWKDAAVGDVLRHAHDNKKPTALICHGPIALLAALDNPQEYIASFPKPPKTPWIYAGYKMTIFSTKEEKQEEPGEDNVLKGYVRFYPDEALDFAGGQVVVRAQKWQNHIEIDRELITGQNPFSDHALADAFIQALAKSKR